MAKRRYQQRRNRHIQERDRRRLDRELRELKDDDFDTWITVEQDQDQDQDSSDQDTGDQDTSYQDTRPQKRRYSSEALDSTDPSTSVGNNIILQYIALFGAYYISAILRIAISY